MSNRSRAAVVAALIAGALVACGSDDGPSAEFTSPSDGDTVAGGVAVAMAAEGVTIEEAGEARDGAGHFHVIADAGCADPGDAIDRDADHVHFGGGQSEGVIFLEPGSHELCLQVGDGTHIALNATDRVTVEVGVTDLEQWCSVVGEIDELFEVTDNSEDDFAVKQVGYENIRRLLAQASSAIDVVDADVREDVNTSLAFAANITTAFVTAADELAVEEALQPIFEGIEESEGLPASDWILDNCGVDIDG